MHMKKIINLVKNTFKYFPIALITVLLSANFVNAFPPPSPDQEKAANEKVKLCESTGGVAEKKSVGGYDPQTGIDLAWGIIVNCNCPKGLIWDANAGCAAKNNTSGAAINNIDLQNSLAKMRLDLKDFKDKKKEEENALAQTAREKVASKRQAAQTRQEAARKAKEEKRKKVLLRLIEVQIKQLDNTKERVAKMPNINTDLKTDLDTKIDAAVVALNAEKAKVQAATATATPEELKNLAKEIRDLLKSKQEIVRQIVKAILVSRTDNAVVKAENRLAEIKAKIAELKAAGKDVAEAEGLFASAEQKVASAKEKSGQKMAKEANDFLKSAYQDMKNIVKKVDTEKTAFFCPQEKYINCMPIITPERQKLCSGEYYEWIKKNCPNVEFTY